MPRAKPREGWRAPKLDANDYPLTPDDETAVVNGIEREIGCGLPPEGREKLLDFVKSVIAVHAYFQSVTSGPRGMGPTVGEKIAGLVRFRDAATKFDEAAKKLDDAAFAAMLSQLDDAHAGHFAHSTITAKNTEIVDIVGTMSPGGWADAAQRGIDLLTSGRRLFGSECAV